MKLRIKNFNGIINVGPNKFNKIKCILDVILKSTNSKINLESNNHSFNYVPLRKVNYLLFKRYFKNFQLEKINSGILKTINWYKKYKHD